MNGAGKDDDILRSPLAKRKKLAAERTGYSKLKEAISANDLHDKEKDGEKVTGADDRAALGVASKVTETMEEEEEDGDGDDEEEEEEEDDFLARELEEEWG